MLVHKQSDQYTAFFFLFYKLSNMAIIEEIRTKIVQKILKCSFVS